MRFTFWKNSNLSDSDNAAAAAAHFDLGRRGEALAIDHLEQSGYRLVAANFSLPVGRNLRDVVINAEIDVVAYDAETLCFVEVKTRASDDFAPPQVNVDLRKRRQIARAALAYRRMLALTTAPYRFDVVTVVLPVDGSAPRVQLIKNFWTAETLRRPTTYQAHWE
jgi:putative endonuclease